MSGKHPNTYYRVSVKAFIRNEKGEVLLVKEKAPFWNLPGGGLDHGETIHDALARELYEEALIKVPFEERLIATESIWLEEKQAWLLWLVCEIQFDGEFEFGIGEDADEIEFIDPSTLQNGERLEERLIYKLSQTH